MKFMLLPKFHYIHIYVFKVNIVDVSWVNGIINIIRCLFLVDIVYCGNRSHIIYWLHQLLLWLHSNRIAFSIIETFTFVIDCLSVEWNFVRMDFTLYVILFEIFHCDSIPFDWWWLTCKMSSKSNDFFFTLPVFIQNRKCHLLLKQSNPNIYLPENHLLQQQ